MYCFTLHFVPAVDNGDKNITCQFFQILSIGAFLRPEINSLHRYDSCCDNIFVSEHNSKFWESIWKNRQKTNNIQIINSQMLQFFSVKRLNYVSNGNWLSSFTQGNEHKCSFHFSDTNMTTFTWIGIFIIWIDSLSRSQMALL